MNQSIKCRDTVVDVAKGIGILLVILGHLKNPIMDFIYAFHMPLFSLSVECLSRKDYL